MLFSAEPPRIDTDGAFPLSKEIRWVAPSPAYIDRQKRQARIATFVCPVLLVALIVLPLGFLYPQMGFEKMIAALERPEMRGKLIEVGLLVLGNLIIVPLALMTSARGFRLGASRNGLDYEISRVMAFGRTPTGRAAWNDVVYDGRWLVAGSQRFVLKAPGSPIGVFDEEELRKVILAHIPKANLLTPNQLQTRGASALWILLVAVLGLGGWMIWMSLNR
jgi:hypothetical protein